MKSIEERAKEAGIKSQYKSDYPYDERSVEYGYILGAAERKKIDIERAILWLRARSEYPFHKLEDSFRAFMEE